MTKTANLSEALTDAMVCAKCLSEAIELRMQNENVNVDRLVQRVKMNAGTMLIHLEID